MATFLPGVTDTRPEQHLYQPDYGFLTNVMGAQQQKYDQGFAKVKSIYNSMLNMPVSNAENEKYRSEVFQKLETQLRSIAKVDLSQGSTVAKASALFDPLTKDNDLIADMRLTKQIGAELAKADAAMNSADPEVRGTYSELSRMDILHAREDLQNGKRGNGSIGSVQANAFTPFQDVKAYLSKKAKEEGLEVVYDVNKGPYLVKTTNGPGTVPLYENWASQTMGSRFDRQFQVEARVGMESQIRALTRQGVPREAALQEVVGKHAPELLKSLGQKIAVKSVDLDTLTNSIDSMKQQFEKEGGIPQDKVEAYNNLITQRNQLQEQLRGDQSDHDMLMSPEAMKHLSGNLQSFLQAGIRARTSHDWAQSHAMLTAKEEMRPDEVVLTQFREQQQNLRQGRQLSHDTWKAKLNHSEWAADYQVRAQVAAHNIDLNERKFAADNEHWQAGHNLKLEDQEIKWAELGVKGYNASLKGAGKSGIVPGSGGAGIAINGTYTAAGQNLTGVDVQMKENQENFNRMYHHAFSMNGSVAEVMIPNSSERLALKHATDKMLQLRNGQKVTFSAEDKQALEGFGRKFGVQVEVPRNRAYANEALQLMTNRMASRVERQLDDAHNHGQYTAKQVKSALEAVEASKAYQQNNSRLQRDIAKVSAAMVDSDGRLKPLYAGATYLGQDANNRPLYDASTIKDQSVKNSLNQSVGKTYLDKTRLTGTDYTVTNPESNLLTGILTSNIHKRIEQDGKDVTNDFAKGDAGWLTYLKSQPGETRQKAIGKELRMLVDPATNTTTFIGNLDGSSALTQGKGAPLPKSGEFRITVDNDKLRQNPDLNRYLTALDNNTPQWSVYGRMTGLDQGKTGKAPKILKNFGIDYTVSELVGPNGPETYVKFDFKNPDPTKERIVWESTQPFPGSVKDPRNAQRVDQFLSQTIQKFIDSSEAYKQKLKQAGGRIPLYDPRVLR